MLHNSTGINEVFVLDGHDPSVSRVSFFLAEKNKNKIRTSSLLPWGWDGFVSTRFRPRFHEESKQATAVSYKKCTMYYSTYILEYTAVPVHSRN